MAIKTKKRITFAARLAELLAEADITAYQLIKDSGVPRSTMSRLVRGECANPTLDSVIRIARALRKSLSVFDDVDLE